MQWIVNLVVVTAVGLLGYFGKRTLTQIDRHQEDMGKRMAESQRDTERKILTEIERMRADMDERQRKAESRIERVEERLNKTLQEMPTVYTLREDWLRTSSSIDRKLDKIMDMLIGRGGHEPK